METNDVPREFEHLRAVVDSACRGLEEANIDAFEVRAKAFDRKTLESLIETYNWLAEDGRAQRLSAWIDSVAALDLRAFKAHVARR